MCIITPGVQHTDRMISDLQAGYQYYAIKETDAFYFCVAHVMYPVDTRLKHLILASFHTIVFAVAGEQTSKHVSMQQWLLAVTAVITVSV